MSKQTVLHCGNANCTKKAAFFGQFAGGLCLSHAVQVAREFGINQFWNRHHEALLAALSSTPTPIDGEDGR